MPKPDILGIESAIKDGTLSASSTNVANPGVTGKDPPQKKPHDLWSKTNTSYSGCDINAVINLNGKLLQIGNLSTLSYSIHREKQPVRTLGRIYPKGYVRGPLTIAGTLIFTVFDQHVLAELRDIFDYEHNIPDLQKSLLPHQFPPFDVVVTYTNEYGHESYLRIYGIEIVDEGQNHSVNDMVSENMMQYIAKDIDLMLKNEDTLTHANLTFGQALFTSDRGVADSQKVILGDRERIRKELSEYDKFLVQLEKEVNDWRKGQSVTNPWPNRVYLKIYKVGGIQTLAEAESYLTQNKLTYKELERYALSYTNVNMGHDPRKDSSFDYSRGAPK